MLCSGQHSGLVFLVICFKPPCVVRPNCWHHHRGGYNSKYLDGDITGRTSIRFSAFVFSMENARLSIFGCFLSPFQLFLADLRFAGRLAAVNWFLHKLHRDEVAVELELKVLILLRRRRECEKSERLVAQRYFRRLTQSPSRRRKVMPRHPHCCYLEKTYPLQYLPSYCPYCQQGIHGYILPSQQLSIL